MVIILFLWDVNPTPSLLTRHYDEGSEILVNNGKMYSCYSSTLKIASLLVISGDVYSVLLLTFLST